MTINWDDFNDAHDHDLQDALQRAATVEAEDEA